MAPYSPPAVYPPCYFRSPDFKQHNGAANFVDFALGTCRLLGLEVDVSSQQSGYSVALTPKGSEASSY